MLLYLVGFCLTNQTVISPLSYLRTRNKSAISSHRSENWQQRRNSCHGQMFATDCFPHIRACIYLATIDETLSDASFKLAPRVAQIFNFTCKSPRRNPSATNVNGRKSQQRLRTLVCKLVPLLISKTNWLLGFEWVRLRERSLSLKGLTVFQHPSTWALRFLHSYLTIIF